MLFSLQILEDFPENFLLFISYLVLLWSGKYILYDLNLLRVTEAYFMAQNLVSVDKCMHVKRMCIPLLAGVFYKCQLGQVGW